MYSEERYNLFIGGKWVKSKGERTFEVTNPANGELLAVCTDAVREDIDEAVDAAWKAFEKYKKSSLDERAEILRKIADRMEENIERLAMVECLDNGKTLNEAKGNVRFAIDYYRYCGGAVHTFEGKAAMLADTTMSLILREPIGVVGQIIPWNVPIILTAWKLGPVLATGCSTVLKPSNHAPLSTLEFIKCISDIIPSGVVNLVTGSGTRCGEYMLDHPGFRKLSFTGSTEVGKRVAMAAAEKLIPATLELGGKSVNIVFPDSNIDHALAAVKAFLVNSAQVCSAGSRLFLHEDIYDEFLARAVNMYNGIKVGLPWEKDTQMGSLTYKEHLDSVLDYVAIGVKEGARIACGGKRIKENGLDKGNFMRPTILADVTNDMRVAREEIFGPVLVAIKFKTEEEVVKMANDNKYGLSGGVFSKDINRAIRVARAVETGRMWVNSYATVKTTGVIFGGCKESGIGREGHYQSFEHYSQVKSIVINLAE